jgi:iron(III) transport system permease protein
MVTKLSLPALWGILPARNSWTLISLVLACILLGPVLAVFVAASGDSEGLWPHLLDTVLPDYVANTLILTAGVAVVSLLFGVSAAWTVFRYDFPGKRWLEWMLLLPAAVPAYLIAYSYTDFLEYAGPVQGILRDLFGWQSARDYWFPEIRSMAGAAFIMGAVLYPYIYMMARVSFVLTPASLFEVAMLAKRNAFWSVALPLGRPAIVAGLAPVLMETISDFGTVEYFAIETLTLGIFNVWFGMNNLAAAAQIATVAFLFIIALLAMEIIARARRRFTDTSRRAVSLPPIKRTGWGACGCIAICSLPIIAGFVIPVGVLLNFALHDQSHELTDGILLAARNTLLLALSVAVLVMMSAAFLGIASAYQGGPFLKRLTAFASAGYAFPGTVLAIGVVTAGSALDASIASALQATLGLSYEGWLTSGVGLVILACAIRFQAIGYGAVASGLERLPPNMMEASRTLGRTFGQSVRMVIAPLIRKPLIAGGLLVFVDVMKELPMTLLLRPFNFETLATYVYQFAKDELLERAALPALIIVLTGIVPVIIMNAAIRRIARP